MEVSASAKKDSISSTSSDIKRFFEYLRSETDSSKNGTKNIISFRGSEKARGVKSTVK
jgi:hypothetical protein